MKISVNIKTGLHARPAALVVIQASKFKSAISIEKGDKKANVKSIIDLLSLGICQHDEIILRTEGSDEAEAITKISSIIKALDNQL